jgi:hypothetical protein
MADASMQLQTSADVSLYKFIAGHSRNAGATPIVKIR